MNLSLDKDQIDCRILNHQSELQFVESSNQLVGNSQSICNLDLESDKSCDRKQLKDSEYELQDDQQKEKENDQDRPSDKHPTNNIFYVGYLITIAKLQLINNILYRQFERMTPKQLQVIRQYSTDHSFYIDDQVIRNKKRFYNKMKQQQEMNSAQKSIYIAYIYTLYQIKNIWLRMELELRYLSDFLERYDFTKNQTFRLVWDIFYVLIIIFQCIYLPLYICFDLDATLCQNQQYLLNYASLLFLSVDCILNFFTGYFSKGNFITSQRIIALHYLQNFFIIDLISLLPQFLVLNPNLGAPKIIQILFVIKFIRLKQVVNKIEDRFLHIFNRIKTFYDLAILFFGILYTAHITGCVLYLICVIQENNGQETMFNQIINEVKNGQKWYFGYIDSFYFSVVTIVTVGYGDYSPKTAFEKSYVIFMILIGCAQHAYSISTIGNIIAEINRQNDEVRQKVGELSEYMYRNNVPSTFMTQVRKNLEYVLEQECSQTKKINQSILLLNNRIRKQLIQHIYFKNIKKISCLNNCGFSENLLQRMSDIVIEQNFGVDNEIKIEGDIHLYYIKKGKAEIQGTIMNEPNQNVIDGQSLVQLSDGDYFNSQPFFSNQIQKNTRLYAKSHCSVIAIPRQKFVEILQQKQFNDENLIFNKIKDNIVLNGSNMDIGLKCYICESKTHYYNKCPLVFFQPNRQNVIDKSNRPQLNRQPFIRKSHRKVDFETKLIEDDNMVDSLLTIDRKSSLGLINRFSTQNQQRVQSRFITNFTMQSVHQWRKTNKTYLDYELVEQMTQSSVSSYQQSQTDQQSLQQIIEESNDRSRNHSDHKSRSDDDHKSRNHSDHKSRSDDDIVIDNKKSICDLGRLQKQNRFTCQLQNYRKSRISNLQNMIQNNQSRIENEKSKSFIMNDGVFRQQSIGRQTQLNNQNNQIMQCLDQIKGQIYLDSQMKLKRQLTVNRVQTVETQNERQQNNRSDQNNRLEYQVEQQQTQMNTDYEFIQTLDIDQFKEFRQHYFIHNNISNIVKEKNHEQSILEGHQYALIQVKKNKQKLEKVKQKIQEFNQCNNIEEMKVKLKSMQDEAYYTIYNDKRLQDENKKKMVQLQKRIENYQNYQYLQTKLVNRISQHTRTIEQCGNQTKKVQQKRRLKYIIFRHNPDLIHSQTNLDINSYISHNYQAYLNALKQKKPVNTNQKKNIEIRNKNIKKQQSHNDQINKQQSNIEMQLVQQNKR